MNTCFIQTLGSNFIPFSFLQPLSHVSNARGARGRGRSTPSVLLNTMPLVARPDKIATGLCPAPGTFQMPGDKTYRQCPFPPTALIVPCLRPASLCDLLQLTADHSCIQHPEAGPLAAMRDLSGLLHHSNLLAIAPRGSLS